MIRIEKCYNCRHAGHQFRIDKMTYLHCEHPKYKAEDFENGKLSAWDTLREFCDSCKDFQFKENK